MFDLDEYSDKREEIAALDKLLSKFQGCDLNGYDIDFVDDMVKRIDRFGSRAHITPRQHEHIETMKRRYHVEED